MTRASNHSLPVNAAANACYAGNEEYQLEYQIAMTMALKDLCQTRSKKRFLRRVIAAAENMDVAEKCLVTAKELEDLRQD